MTACTKLGYATKREAKTALSSAKSKHVVNTWREECRIYACKIEGCNNWHLTHLPHYLYEQD